MHIGLVGMITQDIWQDNIFPRILSKKPVNAEQQTNGNSNLF
jgi:hypothetical protein